jgi:hypothetical protein
MSDSLPARRVHGQVGSESVLLGELDSSLKIDSIHVLSRLVACQYKCVRMRTPKCEYALMRTYASMYECLQVMCMDSTQGYIQNGATVRVIAHTSDIPRAVASDFCWRLKTLPFSSITMPATGKKMVSPRTALLLFEGAQQRLCQVRSGDMRAKMYMGPHRFFPLVACGSRSVRVEVNEFVCIHPKEA